MPQKKQLNKKEKKLIKGCINKEEAALAEFYVVFTPIISAIAKGFAENETEAEDLTEDIFLKILNEMKMHDIKRNLYGWVVSVAKNYCIGIYKKSKTKKAIKSAYLIAKKDKGTALIEIIRDSKAIAPGSKNYHKQEETNLDIVYRNYMPSALKKNLEFSLGLIGIFYNLIGEIKSSPAYWERIFKIHEILLNTKRKVNRIIGRISKEKIEIYTRLRATPASYRSKSEKKQLDKLNKQESFIYIHSTLNEMADRINRTVYGMGLRDFLSAATNAPPQAEYYQAEYYLYQLFDLALKLKTMRIEPPRLMYSVWVKGLRKGKYTHRKKIMLVFYHFKRKTKGTQQEFLFDSIDENLSNFESIRKSYYKRSPKERLYKELVDTIYKSSFVYNREKLVISK